MRVSRAPEFINLSDAASRAVAGATSRHAALIEDAFDVLVETPGGGGLADRRFSGSRPGQEGRPGHPPSAPIKVSDIAEADVRVAIGNARSGGAGPGNLPVGRRGQVAPKTKTQAEYRRRFPSANWCLALALQEPAKTFLAVAHGAGMLLRGEVDRLIVSRPADEAGERLGFLPGDLTEKVDPYMAPVWEALTRDILGCARAAASRPPGEGRDRGRANRVPARAYAVARLCHRRRGSERHASADENGSDPPGRGRTDGGHRRPHADRPGEYPR